MEKQFSKRKDRSFVGVGQSLKSYVTFLQPLGPQPARLLCPQDFPLQNTEVGCYFYLQGIFLTQGQKLCLFHLLNWQVDSLPLNHLRSSQELRKRGQSKGLQIQMHTMLWLLTLCLLPHDTCPVILPILQILLWVLNSARVMTMLVLFIMACIFWT